MNIYLLSQDINDDYDTFDAVVVAAENVDKARETHPSSFTTHISNGVWMGTYTGGDDIGGEYPVFTDGWVKYSDLDKIEVELIGTTDRDAGVILASFNAG